jgi:hypothetical protein
MSEQSGTSPKIVDELFEQALTSLEGVLGKRPYPDIDDLSEYSGTSPKKGRGRSQASKDLIAAMYASAAAAQPITGRGIGYKLFVAHLIASMSTRDMKKVYRLLKEAREEGIIPWSWIVDETRGVEKVATWDNPAEFLRQMAKAYRLDFWKQQPVRCEVWSEKGTVRGVLAPTLDRYGVGFNPVHGFNSATNVHDAVQRDDDRDLIILYVGDYDPSGLCMSEKDLPERLVEYGGHHVKLKRIALTLDHVSGLPSFPASDKKGDTRYKWFCTNYGDRCWELDAMDPNVLRAIVEEKIKELIEPVAWARCETVFQAEYNSTEEGLFACAKPRSRGAHWHPSTAAMSAVNRG